MSGDILRSIPADNAGDSGEMKTHVTATGRHLYREASFRECYHKEAKQPVSIRDGLWNRLKNACSCDTAARKDFLHNMFPFFKVMRKYKWRSMLVNDIVAGLTVGVMLLPQGKCQIQFYTDYWLTNLMHL